jgi:hypothetical protein
MSVREFRSPDGRLWRVWAVQPQGFTGRGMRVGGDQAGDRRRGDRRQTPVETLEDPPILQRRRAPDRRIRKAAGVHRSPAELLPARWRDGWLVFEPVDMHSHGDRARETRRLTPIPECWDGCSDAELAEHLCVAAAREGQRQPVPRSA